MIYIHGNAVAFIPRFLVNFVINKTNSCLRSMQKKEITYGEFLIFIGLQLYMSTIIGYSRRDFWFSAPISLDVGAPVCLGKFTSLKHFETILYNLVFTDEQPPSCYNKFWEFKKMIKLWNVNMEKFFCPDWIVCSNESMFIWFNKWTCPGWAYCPRKPHPFGNEYHDIACGKSHILFRLLLIEGKNNQAVCLPQNFHI